MATGKTLLFIPTYNEHENVERTYNLIKALNLDHDLLFLDDNSPDGTGKILDEIARRDSRVSVIHRSGRLGIGSAHQHGIRHAYDNHYQILISMDCDLTHRPEDIPRFLAEADRADVVLGSRFLQHESLADWNLLRKSLTHLGHLLTKHFLRVPYDATGAFRLYRLDHIRREVFELVQSASYSFFFESLYILCLSKARVVEVPIPLPKRTYGHSKMRTVDVLSSVKRLVVLFFQGFRYKSALRRLDARVEAEADV